MFDLDAINRELEVGSPGQAVAWATRMFAPRLVASSSFQTQSLPLLHIISQVAPQTPVVFVDTGFHFPETLVFRDSVARLLDLNLVILKPSLSRSAFSSAYGYDLYRQDPDLCCYVNKIEPMERMLRHYDAWITGIRRDQSEARAQTRVVESTEKGYWRIHPLATWTRDDVGVYIEKHHLPPHPLLAKGYRSIGCEPCTVPVRAGRGERSGRWVGHRKDECGLHTVMRGENISTDTFVIPDDKSNSSE